jgi:hypothetical protein
MRETRQCQWLTPKLAEEMKSWLRSKTTIAELEDAVSQTKRFKGQPMLAQSERWFAFKAGMQENDEIWKFSSPDDTWENLCGSAGIALVHEGEIVDIYETLMN